MSCYLCMWYVFFFSLEKKYNKNRVTQLCNFKLKKKGSPRGVKHTHPGGGMNKHVLFAAFVHC